MDARAERTAAGGLVTEASRRWKRAELGSFPPTGASPSANPKPGWIDSSTALKLAESLQCDLRYRGSFGFPIFSRTLTVAVPFPEQCVFARVYRTRDTRPNRIRGILSQTLTVAVPFPEQCAVAMVAEGRSANADRGLAVTLIAKPT